MTAERVDRAHEWQLSRSRSLGRSRTQAKGGHSKIARMRGWQQAGRDTCLDAHVYRVTGLLVLGPSSDGIKPTLPCATWWMEGCLTRARPKASWPHDWVGQVGITTE